MDFKPEHIEVCICTYKRKELLTRLLQELENQITDKLITYSIVVVDNDYNQTAKDTVDTKRRHVDSQS